MNARRFLPQSNSALWQGLLLSLFLSLSPVHCVANGSLIAWGANDSFQCVVPAGLTNAMAVAGGESHSVALRPDGTVVAWGFDVSGQTNVPVGLNGVAAISAGSTYSMALQSNGTIVTWGSIATPPPLSNISAISAGWNHALALKNDGTVVAWGNNTHGETTVPANVTNVIAIAGGNGFSLALRADSTVLAWGDNTYGQTNVPANLNNVLSIAAGGGHCLALQRNGVIVAWGRDDTGQIDIPTDASTNIIAISAGALHSIALRSDGSISAWGDNTLNQLAINQTVPGYVALAAGGYHSLAIKGDNFPVILVQPQSKNVFLTKNATNQVVAAGAQPLTYQWQHFGTNINGATSSIYIINNFQVTDSGPYNVVVGNSFGTIPSATATLTGIGGPPVVTTPPANQTVICGDSASFSVVVDGSGPFNYQWKFGSTPITGATKSSLSLVNVSTTNAGTYFVTATNAYGTVTTGAVLTVTVQPPSITSALSRGGKQGQAFSYQITALHTPLSYSAMFLPNGLTVNPITGQISGTPTESGAFAALITAYNACTSDTKTLNLSIASSVPIITSGSLVTGTEGLALTPYQITATDNPTSFGATNLPVGIFVDPVLGTVSGTPIYAGSFSSTISASNRWGVGTATLNFNIANALVQGFVITNFGYSYHAPYLLDYSFALFSTTSNTVQHGIVANPNLFTASATESFPGGTYSIQPGPNEFLAATNNTQMMNLTPFAVSETSFILARGSGKVIKAYLVLDYTASISDPSINGDSNGDGISDAVDYMVAGAQYFVNQQPAPNQMGVYEFHRDDQAPQQVIALTHDHLLLDNTIAGIYTNYVNFFYAGSRCWDAVNAAITALGTPNPDEQHYVIFVSDGNDDSSTNTVNNIIAAANANNVQLQCIAFGADTAGYNNLTNIAARTKGRVYTAANPPDLFNQFSFLSKDFQAQYILRWATLRRGAPFLPDFTLNYQASAASSPAWFLDSSTIIDTNQTPNATNDVTLWTNKFLGAYDPQAPSHIGPVTNGTLRMVIDEEVHPSGLTVRSTYTPRFVRQLKLHYRANWPYTLLLESTNPGDALNGWTVTETSDGAGGNFALLSSPNPASQTNGLPFAWFGPMLTFKFKDVLLNTNNAFSFFTVDNSIYTNIVAGGQTFAFEPNSVSNFITSYPALPHGTPAPWLIALGYPSDSNSLAQAELADKDGDGMANWKEYRSNTDPTNPASVFSIRNIARQPDGRFQITFSTSANRTYDLQSSPNLSTWRTVYTGIQGINTNVTLIDTNILVGNTIFYRAVVY